MLQTLQQMGQGFVSALTWINLLAMVGGVSLGIVIGCLPGLSAAMGVALMLPLTFTMPADTGLIVLGAIYCGAIFGGSISAILIHTPGTPASAATAIEGYQMTLQGKAGKALATACWSSFWGGLLSCISLYFFSPLLAQLALKFMSAEKFWLGIFGLTIIAGVSSKSMVKGLMSGALGLLISTIGLDPIDGTKRFMFGQAFLAEGINTTCALIGLFSMSQVLILAEKKIKERQKASKFSDKIALTKAEKKMLAPTVIRSLMRLGEAWAERYDLRTLRILGSVGEPINPEAWHWYHKNIGGSELPIVDTWWQTETGGAMISPLPYATKLKPGSASRPLPGIDAAVMGGSATRDGEDGDGSARSGHLVIRRPWPGMMQGVYNDEEKYQSYFSRFGCYESGDGAEVDEDGYFWILGRVDDSINVSGHRLSTAEIEAVLASCPEVAEAAVVPMPHALKGEGIYAYVVTRDEVPWSDDVRKKLRDTVRRDIGALDEAVALPLAAVHYADQIEGFDLARIQQAYQAGAVTKDDISQALDEAVGRGADGQDKSGGSLSEALLEQQAIAAAKAMAEEYRSAEDRRIGFAWNGVKAKYQFAQQI